MEFKHVGVVCFMLRVIGIDISYAETLHIDVLNTTCGQTLHMTTYDRIKLEYVEESLQWNFDNMMPRCVFTIVNNDTDMQICITGWGSTAPHWGKGGCEQTFKFYIGYLPNSDRYGGYSCNSFRQEPICTRHWRVYAVFQDTLVFFEDIAKIDIYKKNIYVPTTTSRTITTRNWSSNDESNETGDPHGSMTMIAIVVVVVAVVLACVCCVIYRYNRKKDTPERITEQSNPEPVYQTPRRQVQYTADAPPYSSVMQQQQHHQHLLPDETTTNIQVHDHLHPTAPPIDSLPENQHSDIYPPDDNPMPDNRVNQTIPTTPPPNYDDVEPPPYPGNWSSS